MAKRGLLSFRGSMISKVGMEKILRNPFYCGLIRITRGKAVYPGVHEPLITPSLFEKVQAVREGRTAKAATKHSYLFRGLFSCGLCGTTMIAERQKGHVYYRCHTSSCETKTIREDVLRSEIRLAVCRLSIKDADTDWLTEQFRQWAERRLHDPAAGAYAMQLAQIEERLQRLTDALVDRIIDRDEYIKRKESLLLEKAKVSHALERSKSVPDEHTVRKFLERAKSLALTYEMADDEEARAIVQLTTSNRTVSRRNVVVEPANWLLQMDSAIAGLLGGLHRPDSRRWSEIRDLQVERLTQVVQQTAVYDPAATVIP
jgi:hypothetical protein